MDSKRNDVGRDDSSGDKQKKSRTVVAPAAAALASITAAVAKQGPVDQFDVFAFISDYVSSQAGAMGMTQETLEDFEKDFRRSPVESVLFPSVIGEIHFEMPLVTPAVFVVRDEEAIVGYAIILDKTHRVSAKKAGMYPKLFELAAIWVDERKRGKGERGKGERGKGEQSSAHHLREKCLSWAREQGATHVLFENTVKDSEQRVWDEEDGMYRHVNGEENDRAARSLLKRGAIKVGTDDKPFERGEVFILDMSKDEELIRGQMGQIRTCFESAAMEPCLAKLCREGADLRNAILDGRLASCLVEGGALPKEALYRFGPTYLFAGLNLKSLMMESEIERWIAERSAIFSVEQKDSLAKGTEGVDFGDIVFMHRNLSDDVHLVSLLELMGSDFRAQYLKAPWFRCRERAMWKASVIKNFFSSLKWM